MIKDQRTSAEAVYTTLSSHGQSQIVSRNGVWDTGMGSPPIAG